MRLILILFTLVLFYKNALAQSTVEYLLKSLANKPNNKVKFIETRNASFLVNPLTSKGVMEFEKNSIMIKRTLSPEPSEQSIIGNELLIKNNSQERRIPLAKYPVLASGINAMRWMLSGNLDNLNKDFDVSYTVDKQIWSVNLIPKDKQALSKISNILLTGQEDVIFYIKVVKTDDTYVLTTFYE